MKATVEKATVKVLMDRITALHAIYQMAKEKQIALHEAAGILAEKWEGPAGEVVKAVRDHKPSVDKMKHGAGILAELAEDHAWEVGPECVYGVRSSLAKIRFW